MKKNLIVLATFLALICAVIIVFRFYPYIFARDVDGTIEGVERVSLPMAIVGTGLPVPNKELFSYAVAIREKSGEIVTASAEDRQWAVATKGQCALARFYPYPPWELDKSGTYYGARLLKLTDCGSPSPSR